MQRFSLNVQRQLPLQVVAEVGYIGNRGVKLSSARQFDGVPPQYLSKSPVRDQATIDFLNDQVANPFLGIPSFSGTGLAAARVARSQLLRPYPHFTSISISTEDGYSMYHAMTVSLEKRFSRGLLFHSNWPWSKFMEAISYLNDSDLRPAYTISDLDATYRFVLSGIYELPFGRGKALFGKANRFWDLFIGGWQVQGSYSVLRRPQRRHQ
jgi:hypothetical protein